MSLFTRHTTQLKPLQLKGVSGTNMVWNVLVLLWHPNKSFSAEDETSKVPCFSFKINLDLLLPENPSDEYCSMCNVSEQHSHFTSSLNASWQSVLWIISSLIPPLLTLICFPEIFLPFPCFCPIFLSGVLENHFVTWTFKLITSCSVRCLCRIFETWEIQL